MRRALITGITGQDGSYLAELLLGKGYEVHGLVRRSSSFHTQRLDAIYQDPHAEHRRLTLHYADLADASSLARIVRITQPDEIYHLGAQSHVRVSFDVPEHTAEVTGMGTLRMLEAVREHCPHARFYQASSSEMFGNAPAQQSETTAIQPRSPYGCAKAFAHHCTRTYREAHGIHATSGILFNHESPRRGETFVTRKITRAIAQIVIGAQDKLFLGNLAARRDWGYAPEYVEAMWRMLQRDTPDDYVIATGEMHSVSEFLDEAFGLVERDWHRHVEIDPRYFRPAEVDTLCGDASKAARVLGWTPQTSFRELVRVMLAAELEAVGRPLPA